MDVFIVLENDVIVKIGVSLVLVDPISFQVLLRFLNSSLAFLSEFFARKFQDERLVLVRGGKCVFMLLDITLDHGDLLVKLLDLLFFTRLLGIELLLLLFFLFSQRLIFANVML